MQWINLVFSKLIELFFLIFAYYLPRQYFGRVVKLAAEKTNAVNKTFPPAGERRPLRQWTPSRRHEKGEAEPPLGRRSAHQDSTRRNLASWSPTSCWKLKRTHTEADTSELSFRAGTPHEPECIYSGSLKNDMGQRRAPLPSHSLLAMVSPSWPKEQLDISLSALVTLALRPPSSAPPPSALVSEDVCEAEPPGVCSASRNTFEWLWILSAREGEWKRKEKDERGGKRKGNALISQQLTQSLKKSMLLFDE